MYAPEQPFDDESLMPLKEQRQKPKHWPFVFRRFCSLSNINGKQLPFLVEAQNCALYGFHQQSKEHICHCLLVLQMQIVHG